MYSIQRLDLCLRRNGGQTRRVFGLQDDGFTFSWSRVQCSGYCKPFTFMMSTLAIS